MSILVSGVVALWVGASAASAASESYAFFAQSTIASHEDGHNHALPSMARLSDGRILVAWCRFAPGSGDFAVVGAFSSDCGCSWTRPQVFIDHKDTLDADPSIVVSGNRVFVTCTTVTGGGINTSATWCVRSKDNGHTWSAPYEIPMNHRYTCGKCHRGLRLESGTLLLGYSWDVICEKGETLTSEGQMDLRAGVMRSTDNGDTWTNGGDTHAVYDKVSAGAVLGTDEPAIVELDDGSVYMLMRTGSSHLYEARSTDQGLTWHDVRPSLLRGSNAPAALSRFAVDENNGVLVVWDNALERYPLCAAASFDGCRTWTAPKDIGFPYTGGQASYPSCVQARDGTLLAVWQQDVPGGRDVRLARFSAAWLLSEEQAETEKPGGETVEAGPMTVVLFGDSTTAPRGPLRVFGQLLAEELGGRAEVVNAGGGGNTTAIARRRFERDVLARKPDVVTVLFGLNDAAVDVCKGATKPRVPLAQFEENLRHFVQELRGQGATPILLTPNPLAWTPELKDLYGKPPYDPDHADGFNVFLEEYAAAVRDIAKSEDAPLIDVYQIFKERAKGDSIHKLLLDGMHPSDLGHRIIADELRPVLCALLAGR